MSCSMVSTHQRFGGIFRHHPQDTVSSELSASAFRLYEVSKHLRENVAVFQGRFKLLRKGIKDRVTLTISRSSTLQMYAFVSDTRCKP
jgi:hypothetical protein